MKMIFAILLWIWQTPQNLVGLALRLWYRKVVYKYVRNNVTYRVVPELRGSGISLASTVMVRYFSPELTMLEYGHVRQSRILGPLYLLVVGIPSLIWAAYWTPQRGVSYCSFYTEKWADKLGGVIRKEQ